MSVTITINIVDTLSPANTTDTFVLPDALGQAFVSVLATANAPQPTQQQIRQAQNLGLQPPVVVPLTPSALYHQMAQNMWAQWQARVQQVQEQQAVATAMASVNVQPLAATMTSTG